MAASHTISGGPWPAGATVSAFRRGSRAQPLGTSSPPGQAVAASGVVSGSSVTFAGLTEGERYWAVGQDAAGGWRWVSFRVTPLVEAEPEGLRVRVKAVEDRVIAADSSYLLASAYGLEPGVTDAEARAALLEAVADLAGGGHLLLDYEGVVTVDPAGGSITVPGDVTISGRGRDATRLKLGDGGSGVQNFLRVTGTSSVELRDFSLEGPATHVAGDNSQLTYIDATAGCTRLVRMRVLDCSYGTHVTPSSPSSHSVVWDDVDFDGGSAGGQDGAFAIQAGSVDPGQSSDKKIAVRHCRFRNFGKNASALIHAIYVYPDFNLLVDDCDFEGGIGTGYCIQVYNVLTTQGGQHRFITRNRFATARALVSGQTGYTFFGQNTYSGVLNAVKAVGRLDIVDNRFLGGATGWNTIESDDDGAWIGEVRGNKFHGTATRHVYVQSDVAERVVVRGNDFAGASQSFYVEVNSAGAQVVVEDNDFSGAAASGHVRLVDAARVGVVGNRFAGSGGSPISVSSTQTITRLDVLRNDFSHSNASTAISATSLPAVTRMKGNYGTHASLTHRTEAYGRAFVADGATITHSGLREIPAHVLLSCETTGVIVTPGVITATTITVNLRSHDGTTPAGSHYVSYQALDALAMAV